MHVKRLLSLLLTALLAVTVLAGCAGRSDFSKEAADALNNAQAIVHFSTDSQLTKALKNSLKDNVQPDDVRNAMAADKNLQALLTDGYQLNILAVQADDANAAAQAIAQNASGIVAGKKSEGKIAMVLADNGYYYAAVLTYQDSSNSGGSSNDDDDGADTSTPSVIVDGTTVTVGTPATITDKNENSYVVALQQQADGSLTVTITLKTMQGCYQITKVSIGGQTYSPNDDGSYTIENVSSGAVITVTIEDIGYSVDDDGNYTVTNEKGLLAWVQTVAQEETSPDCTLLQDITLTNWVSAGNGFASTYAGTFDGQGHTITLQGGSLFHYIAEGGVVQNLIVDLQGTTISTSTSPAGAIANTNEGTIQNCMVKNGTVTTSNGNVGGIAGQNDGIIKGCCTVDMSITQSGINNAGGIAGSNQSDSQIIACCAVDCMTSTSTQASHGGILGINRGMVDTCYWEGEDEEGIGANLKGGVVSSVDKISDSTTCESAIAAMNAKGGNYTLGADGKPTLAISAANDPVGQLLRTARLFGL